MNANADTWLFADASGLLAETDNEGEPLRFGLGDPPVERNEIRDIFRAW